jgi:AraC family ethanolamine operon transcriptional activator
VATLNALVSDRTLPRPSLFPAGLVVDVRTTNGEELEAASVGWEVRYAQLGTGRCRCRHLGVHTARLQLCVETWSLGMLKMGRAPRGSVTFLVPVGRNGAPRIQGRGVASGDVVVLFDNDEFDYRSAGPARLVSVSIEWAALESHVRGMLGRRHGELRLQGRLRGLWTDPVILERICGEFATRTAADPRFLEDAALASRLEAKLVKALLSEFETPRDLEATSRSRSLARKAEAWLRQSLAEPPTIATLCEALRASERTLHEAFRQHLGTTPKAYLKTLRLNAARHDLLRGLQKTRVTDVALDWGFLHFGWFSQDYRRLFDETPSQTLQRGRAEAGGASWNRRFFATRVTASPAFGDALVSRFARLGTEEGPWREKRP